MPSAPKHECKCPQKIHQCSPNKAGRVRRAGDEGESRNADLSLSHSADKDGGDEPRSSAYL